MELQNLYEIYLAHPLISKDTRSLPEGCIYWSIKGDNFDGNAYAADALEKGAAYAIIDNEKYKINEKMILVKDSLKTLQDLAKYHRRQLDIPVLAITGSNGKTTSKELINRVLSTKMKAFATPGNLNNHIGLPLSLLMLTKEHEVAVIELGANHIGENAFLCDICLPDYGIITNISKDHLEGFGDLEGVEKANIELFDYLSHNGGIGLVNLDDVRIVKHAEKLTHISYGLNSGKISGKIVSQFPFIRAEVKDVDWYESITVQSNLFGSYQVYNILAATVVGTLFSIEKDQIKTAIESYVPSNNRSQIIKKGTNTIILDAYNANPGSMVPAVIDFTSYPADKKVLLLGDMFELGDFSASEHRNVLSQIKFDKFYKVALAGPEFMSQKNSYPAEFFNSTDELCDWLSIQNLQNSTIYVKGSRGMKMEKTLDSL